MLHLATPVSGNLKLVISAWDRLEYMDKNVNLKRFYVWFWPKIQEKKKCCLGLLLFLLLKTFENIFSFLFLFASEIMKSTEFNFVHWNNAQKKLSKIHENSNNECVLSRIYRDIKIMYSENLVSFPIRLNKK